MLQLESIFSGYKKKNVIENISYTFEKGQLYSIVGPNGAGKTTLLRNIGQLLDYEGKMTFLGEDLQSMPRKEISKIMAFLSQEENHYFPYTVLQTVLMGRYSRLKGSMGNYGQEDYKLAEKYMKQLRIEDIKGKPINQISGGQRQRALLARALVQESSVLLLDEPTNHLDLSYQVELLTYAKKWAREENKLVIVVLHDLNLARNYTDEVLLLHNGLLIEAGKTSEVLYSDTINDVYQMDVSGHMLSSYEVWKSCAR